MCGISAVVDYAGEGGTAGRALALMHEALRHRGPDGEGFLLGSDDGSVARWSHAPPGSAWTSGIRSALAFRQLKIQDLTPAGEQPMASADGRFWVVLNGEIYNHRELRADLERRGHRFRGNSDTEVALAAWAEWGEGCLARFNGMWAMLVLDLEQRRIIGSRDRLGIKPLFHARDGRRLLLASEPQAIVRALTTGPAIEPVRFAEFLRGVPPQSAELSFFRDVHPVPAGTLFAVDLRAVDPPILEFRPYWQLADHAVAEPGLSFDMAREELHALLRSSVEYQRQAAVSVGCLLSGGLDSSIVATLLAGAPAGGGTTRPKAFSVVYDDPGMSEAPYVWAVAQRAGLDSVRHTFTASEAWGAVDRVVATQGQPLLGQELIAQDSIYALARQHGAIVVLEGQGADELLGGLPLYERALLRELVLGGRLRELAVEVRHRQRRYDLSWAQAVRRYAISPAVRGIGPPVRTYDWMERPGPRADAPLEESADPSLLNRFLFGLVRHTNIPVVLLYQDRSSMAHGVESRVPYLDHRVVELCFRMPAGFKVGRGERKRILRSIAGQYLPPLVLNRTDKKMLVSMTGWLPLRDHEDELREMIADGALRACPYLRPASVARFVEDWLRGRHADSAAVWRLYTAWRWLRAFGAT